MTGTPKNPTDMESTDDRPDASSSGPAASRQTQLVLDCAVCGRFLQRSSVVSEIGDNARFCRVCHRTWRGVRPVHCMACHRTFGGKGAAEAAGCCTCLSDETLIGRGFAPDSAGVWRQRPPEWFAAKSRALPRLSRQEALHSTCMGPVAEAPRCALRNGADDG